jgi:hypothetical protein
MHVIANELGIRFYSGLYKGITANGVLLELAAPIFTRVWFGSRSRSELPQHSRQALSILDEMKPGQAAQAAAGRDKITLLLKYLQKPSASSTGS